MKKLLISLCFIFFVHISGFCEGWIELFDGKSLNGWTEKTKEGSFEVVDGSIVGTMVLEKGTTFLCYDGEFRDFELEFEIHIIDPELNSGVQIRSRCKEAKGKQKYGAVYGPQVELASKSDKTRSGFIFGQGWKSWLTPKEVPSHSHFLKNSWNKVRVLAQGPFVKTWINDQFIYETKIPAERHKTNASGFIALQCHGINEGGPSQVAWKNIRIKEL